RLTVSCEVYVELEDVAPPPFEGAGEGEQCVLRGEPRPAAMRDQERRTGQIGGARAARRQPAQGEGGWDHAEQHARRASLLQRRDRCRAAGQRAGGSAAAQSGIDSADMEL